MKFKAKVFTGIVLLLFSCKTQLTVSNPSAKPGTLYSGHFKKPVIDKALYAATMEVIPIDTAYATGDSLHIITPKIQGCDADDFSLMWDRVLSNTKPAQATLKLFQSVNPACKAKSRFNLTFNIKPMRQKADSVPNKTVMIRVANYKGVVRYDY